MGRRLSPLRKSFSEECCSQTVDSVTSGRRVQCSQQKAEGDVAATQSDRKELPFDRVVVGDVTYSVEEFMQLPLTRRVRYILSREAEFFRGGIRVEATEALNGLGGQAGRKR
jgi:hypothetical protein